VLAVLPHLLGHCPARRTLRANLQSVSPGTIVKVVPKFNHFTTAAIKTKPIIDKTIASPPY
jgi:hypothetical protein